MASVYKVYEAALDRYVALKVLPGEFLHDPTFAERFRREAKVVARLEHPNIIPIYSFDIERGVPWMAMRMIAGGTLSSRFKGGGRLGPDRTVAILRGVAAALDYAPAKRADDRWPSASAFVQALAEGFQTAETRPTPQLSPTATFAATAPTTAVTAPGLSTTASTARPLPPTERVAGASTVLADGSAVA